MKVNKKELYGALLAVSAGLTKKEGLEQTNSFIFTNGNVYAYNDEIAIYHPVNVDFFDGAIYAEDFLAFLKTIKNNEVDIEIIEDTTLQIKSGRSKAKFSLDAEIKVPVIKDCEEWKDIPDGLISAMQFCEVTVSDDESRGVMTCVHIKDDVVESTDNFRYTRHLISEKCEDDLLIPKYAIKHIGQHNPVQYGKTDGWLLFKNDLGVILACRTYPNNFINTEGIRKIEGTSFCFPNNLEEELEKASIFAKSENGQTPFVELAVKKGKLILKATNELSDFRSSIKIDDKKINFKIFIQPKFLKEALNMTEECVIGSRTIKLSGADFEHIVSLVNPNS